ncbi:uncharacterized protein F4807DRAFT_202433 [Annulohypoxylon truncatum]|uniref:uncharacterized protein n=1 Tax=Annulohypoxylon truncatum TaxID=327061 RepID=UPI002008287C|nr:uncharacterized protein F4807DRAFT_202433 [Annulohypoxylon truncatum]KAI1213847.1 hypothetical protein F4807DRAFT_202433 [Annulohypoxylon truncatum]
MPQVVFLSSSSMCARSLCLYPPLSPLIRLQRLLSLTLYLSFPTDPALSLAAACLSFGPIPVAAVFFPCLPSSPLFDRISRQCFSIAGRLNLTPSIFYTEQGYTFRQSIRGVYRWFAWFYILRHHACQGERSTVPTFRPLCQSQSKTETSPFLKNNYRVLFL